MENKVNTRIRMGIQEKQEKQVKDEESKGRVSFVNYRTLDLLDTR